MASRKSARVTANAKEDIVTAIQLEKEKLGGRKSKKQKTSNEKDTANDNTIAGHSNRSRIKGKRENSKFMKDIPVDVLLEIFSHLQPEDLLHLSRVSKSLHDLLTSNDLIFLWKLVSLAFFVETMP